MINVVAHNKTDADALEQMMVEKGYHFKRMFTRVFVVDARLDQFEFKNSSLVSDAREPISGKRHFDATEVIETNIKTRRGAPESNDNRSWGPQRIIRRKNPFSRQGAAYQDTFSMGYMYTRSGVGVDIYIIDVGMNANHVDFQGSVTNIDTGETAWNDVGGFAHGTAVTSCAAGRLTGIARQSSVFYIPALVGLAFSDTNLLEEFQQAYSHYVGRAGTNRPAVVNASWGWDMTFQEGPSPSVAAAIDDMISAGMMICISAGNTRWDLDVKNILPAEADPDIIVVGATNAQDMPMYFIGSDAGAIGTSTGSPVTVYAPGEGCAVANGASNTSFILVNGTSYSSPYTAGVLACMLEGYQRLNSRAQVQAVKQKLIDNSTKDVLKFNAFYPSTVVHNRLLYLDPFIALEEIPGLIPL